MSSGVVLTLGGIGLFRYLYICDRVFMTSSARIERFGLVGFAIILGTLFSADLRGRRVEAVRPRALLSEASRHDPGRDDRRSDEQHDPARAFSISGTAKAVAVRKRVPLVVGLSSVATENLFYSF